MQPLLAPISRSLALLLGKTVGPALGSYFRRSLPELEGAWKAAGLSSSVEVLRDRYGVPQVFAGSEYDLFFGQGYVHAQDRFFQMELQRRAGHGRLAEVLGASGLEFDRLARVVGFSRIANASVSVPSGEPRGETLRALDAYSAGVNACLAVEPRAGELRLLRVRPEPWTPADTAAWSLVMAWSLSASWENELAGQDEDAGEETAWSEPGGSGSNAWAVAPSRSATGSALLAGDPHLALGIPSLWYEVGLYGGRYEVVGASLPGTPGVVIGHNRDLAWSVTAALTDVQDLFVERFHADDPRLYEHDGGWLETEVREVEISVRGRRKPAKQRVRSTVNGPVVTDAVDHPGGEDMALRWATPEPLKLVEAGLAVDRAATQAELLQALGGWQAPNQNFVYADRLGTVGWALAGHVPVRPSHTGETPVPGWTERHRWRGFLTFQEMPRGSDPASGTVVSANEPPPGAEDLIPGRYLPEYRKRRIEALLEERHLHDIEGFRAIQADLYCAPAHALARRLARLEAPGAAPDHVAKDLARWDGRLTAGSRPGALARVTLEVLLRRAAGPLSQKESSVPSGVDARLADMLPRVVAKLDELADDELLSAMEEAFEIVSSRCGDDPAGWTWGTLHEFEFRHPLGAAKALSPFFNRGPYPAGGDANTPNLSGFRSGGAGRPRFSPVTTGPNYRFVVDTGDWDRAWSVLSPGQSGNPASPNYDDQVGLWLGAGYRPMVFGRKNAELAAKHKLTLVPA